MFGHPGRERFHRHETCSHRHYNPLLLVDARLQLRAVQHEHHLHGRMPDPLVAVNEWMVRDEQVPKRCCFRRQRRIQIHAPERHRRLRNARLERWTSAPAARAAHPREEHLIPLMVASGAAGNDAALVAFNDTFTGLRLSAYHFGT